MLMHLKVFSRILKGNYVTTTSIAGHIRMISFHNTKKIMDVETWSLIQKPRQAKADLLGSIINITRKKGKFINHNWVKANTIKAK